MALKKLTPQEIFIQRMIRLLAEAEKIKAEFYASLPDEDPRRKPIKYIDPRKK